MKKATLNTSGITSPPVVEIDTEASATYIRLSELPVVKSIALSTEKPQITADLDASNGIVGIEVIGAEEFTIDRLLDADGMRGTLSGIPRPLLEQTRYVPAVGKCCEEKSRSADPEELWAAKMIDERADEPSIAAEEVFKELGI